MLIDHGQGRKSRCDFGSEINRAAYAHQFAAHYSELGHEILEVNSGYRLELTYSLCWKAEDTSKNRKSIAFSFNVNTWKEAQAFFLRIQELNRP